MTIIDLPSTSTEKIAKRLVALRRASGNSTVTRVLTLVVCVDDGEEVESSLITAGAVSHEHPCRVIVVAQGQREAATRLDGQIRIGGEAGASEFVILRLYGPLADHGDSVVMPFLVPDTPVVAWWPGIAPQVPALHPLGALASRRITSSLSPSQPSTVMHKLVQGFHPGDTDLAWAMATSIRSIITGALDEPPREPLTEALVSGPESWLSLNLVAGWLSERLGIPVQRITGDFEVSLHWKSAQMTLTANERGYGRLQRPGWPESTVNVSPPDVSALLAQELRFLDPDDMYKQALQGFSKVITSPSSTQQASLSEELSA